VNYLKHHDLNFINHLTKVKIKNLINKALAIAFIRAGHCKTYKYSQVAAHLDYTFNYLIDPSKSKISRDNLFSSCEKSLYDSLSFLPDSSNDIPFNIKIKFPVALLITNSKDVGIVAGALRFYFKFTLLPPSFFLKKPSLPSSPEKSLSHQKY